MIDPIITRPDGSISDPDSDVSTSASQGGFASFLRDTFGSIPLFSRLIAINLVAGRQQGTATNKSKVAVVDVVTTGGSNALMVSQAGAGAVSLTASSPTAATVGVASAAAVSANTNRKGLVLVNTSAATISIAFGAAAVLNSGITLMANGGTFVMDNNTFNTGEVRAIAGAAASNMAVQEFT